MQSRQIVALEKHKKPSEGHESGKSGWPVSGCGRVKALAGFAGDE